MRNGERIWGARQSCGLFISSGPRSQGVSSFIVQRVWDFCKKTRNPLLSYLSNPVYMCRGPTNPKRPVSHPLPNAPKLTCKNRKIPIQVLRHPLLFLRRYPLPRCRRLSARKTRNPLQFRTIHLKGLNHLAWFLVFIRLPTLL